MRILAGRFRGRNIATSRKLNYRPTQSRIRKSIFDRLTPFRYNSVLDLFAGSGIMGFEAASRGSNFVTLVENDKKCYNFLLENSRKLEGADFQIVYADAIRFLKNGRNFDLIFADPPYGHYDLDNLINITRDRLRNKGKFILECEKQQKSYPDSTNIIYGDTQIMIWTKN